MTETVYIIDVMANTTIYITDAPLPAGVPSITADSTIITADSTIITADSI